MKDTKISSEIWIFLVSFIQVAIESPAIYRIMWSKFEVTQLITKTSSSHPNRWFTFYWFSLKARHFAPKQQSIHSYMNTEFGEIDHDWLWWVIDLKGQTGGKRSTQNNLWLYPSKYPKTAWFFHEDHGDKLTNLRLDFLWNFQVFSRKLLKKFQRCCTSFLEFPVRLESFSANSRACRTRSSWL